MQKPSIRELLVRLEKVRKQFFAPLFAGFELTPGQGQAAILHYLSKQDHLTQRELADICRLETATMSRNLDKLEAMGLLTRESNAACRRSFLICLTEKGRAHAAGINQALDQFEQVVRSDISEEELKVFYSVLERMCGTLERAVQREG